MKKVVVKIPSNNNEIVFEGKDLHVMNRDNILVIIDGYNVNDVKNEIAVFNEWTYWKKVEYFIEELKNINKRLKALEDEELNLR